METDKTQALIVQAKEALKYAEDCLIDILCDGSADTEKVKVAYQKIQSSLLTIQERG